MNTYWTVEILIGKLHDPSPFVRSHAVALLGGLGQVAEPAVPYLLDLLESSDVAERRLAALTLAEIGPGGEAITALLEAESTEINQMAQDAVGRVELDGASDEAA